jgi:hypothetical protein
MAKQVKQGWDAFNGEVEILELEGTDDKRFVAKQHRKDVTTEPSTLENAEAAFNGFIDDTMF